MPKATPTTAPKDDSVEAKLDVIIAHLEKMDARDKLRMWGGFVKACLSLIPLVIFLASLWYIAANGKQLMEEIANVAASAAAQYTQGQSKSLYDEIMNKYQIPTKK